jgi:hypothetical protein
MAGVDQPGPILVLASGQRCGSTLVQRLLSSHPDVIIWGEHGGHLREILHASRTLRLWDVGLAGTARQAYEEGSHQSWMANLLPEPDVVDDAARAYVQTLFASPAAALGKSTWGFKEVRFGLEEAEWLRELFPETRVVHITRDPCNVLRSLDSWEREGWWPREYTGIALDAWTEVNESFLRPGEAQSWVGSWRYEDIAARPDDFLPAVARLTGLEPAALDRSVFDRKIDGYNSIPRPLMRTFAELPTDLRRLLDDERLREVASAYDYALSPA